MAYGRGGEHICWSATPFIDDGKCLACGWDRNVAAKVKKEAKGTMRE